MAGTVIKPLLGMPPRNHMIEAVRILLVDDHEVVRMGMKALLNQHQKYRVIAEAGSEDDAVAAAIEHQPDIILMDIRLSQGSGIEACARIMREAPTKIIMLTSFAEDELLFGAIRAGAIGYVLKQAGSRDLLRAIDSAAKGDGAIDPSLTQRIFDEMRHSLEEREANAFSELSEQEKAVLLLIADGAANKAIAEQLHLSQGTVRNYVSSILSKLHLANRVEAAAYAIKHRLHDHV